MSGRIVIGIDEAGYGPSMGPLVLGGTAWWLADSIQLTDAWDSLAPNILPKPAFPRVRHIPLGDSKQLLKGVHGWPNLSLGAEWMFKTLFGGSDSIAKLLPQLIPNDAERLRCVPWYESLFQCGLSTLEVRSTYFKKYSNSKFDHAYRDQLLSQWAPGLCEQLGNAGICLIAAEARVVDEPEFNLQVSKLGNKSTLLSQLSLELAKSIAMKCLAFAESEQSGSRRIELYFDKHGGRSKYQALLVDCFDGNWFSIEEETPGLSRYSGSWDSLPVKAQFMAKGDSLLPSASASVIAKWLREISMASLNDFWQSHRTAPLVPTAGYYVDALRFSKDIASSAERLGLPSESWWRVK